MSHHSKENGDKRIKHVAETVIRQGYSEEKGNKIIERLKKLRRKIRLKKLRRDGQIYS